MVTRLIKKAIRGSSDGMNDDLDKLVLVDRGTRYMTHIYSSEKRQGGEECIGKKGTNYTQN